MLYFRIFDLESDVSCRYDYLEVFNGHTTTAQRLGRFCGTFRPGAILSTGNTMMLRMVSDEQTGGRGFLAQYSAGAPHVNDDQFCGGKLQKPQGTLNTPDWPEKNYPAGISCSWHIIAPPDHKIHFTFGKFDIEQDSYCRYDYVAIFNGGQNDNSKRIGKYCGDRSPQPIMSTGNELLIQFVSDLSVTSGGFEASYVMKPLSGTEDTALPPASLSTPKPTKKSTMTTTAATSVGTPKPKPKPKPTKKTQVSKVDVESHRPDEVTQATCQERCKKTGTIQSNFCSSDFVLTGTVKSAAKGADDRVHATISIIKVYKEGNLRIQQAGQSMTVKVIAICKRCPLLKRGLSYILMGQVDEEGRGKLLPESFTLLYKAPQENILRNLQKRSC
ncbi:procollagen C-endopeptidase enhancer 2-like isoform X2 [Protopterus annectens]|nr:procollagen C-endopeptidase enhancer 2-like isoform X2 [Protopterus annectens]